MKPTHKIEYSAEHVHVVFDNDIETETCFLSRNWDRCTVDDHNDLSEFDKAGRWVRYYDGSAWRTIRGDSPIPQHI